MVVMRVWNVIRDWWQSSVGILVSSHIVEVIHLSLLVIFDESLVGTHLLSVFTVELFGNAI